jgi:two-component system alkaline phosphatase synthesis response regulator PhoP
MEKINKKILIVEDDRSFLWILKQSFESEGFFVLFASDGETGMDLAEKENPDLIIADILMPRIDGITMAKKLKEKGIETPVIFLTNLKDTEHIDEAVELGGGADYIIKSDVHVDQVIAMVKKKLAIE